MFMKPEKWYQRRLSKYFTEHYEQYEDTAEYFPDPFVNQWLFDIPERGVRVELTCTDEGVVKEQRYRMKQYTDNVYEVVEKACDKLDALYEDYIISLIGEEGFELLRYEGFLTTCGSINGRTLYVLS